MKILRDCKFNRLLSLKLLLLLAVLIYCLNPKQIAAQEKKPTWWEFQSIDTMKYSRDLAREKVDDTSFNQTIDLQVNNIAQTGATHVAIATPYDEEFIPFLTRWVEAARKYELNIWFRGNWSGWEGWFDYPPITPEEHIRKTKAFIFNQHQLFEDGDIFSPCPECENGVLGDPRQSGKLDNYRAFLIRQHQESQKAFETINKAVKTNYASMNADVATLVMDPQTAEALGGVVVIDHYVASPQVLSQDIKRIAQRSNSKIILGEFGASIPDIHGSMTEEEQAEWINNALMNLSAIQELIGINYWTSVGGSTQLWKEDGTPLRTSNVIHKYYRPLVAVGSLRDQLSRPIAGASISSELKSTTSDEKGEFILPFLEDSKAKITAQGFSTREILLTNDQQIDVVLVRENNWFSEIGRWLKKLWKNLLELTHIARV